MSRVFSLWIGPQLSIYEKLTLVSALKYKHEFTLFSYESIKVPTGIITADANKIIPSHYIKKVNNSFASFSNIFRYTVLRNFEFDAWVDMDIVFNSENLPSSMGYIFGYENDFFINNAVLGYPPKSAISENLINNAQVDEGKWGKTGPLLLTKIIERENLKLHCQNKEVFYPIDPWKVNLLLSKRKSLSIQKKVEQAHTIHLWMDIFKRFGFRKDKLPPKTCFLRKILEEFELLDYSLSTLTFYDLLSWRVKFYTGKMKHMAANVSRSIVFNVGDSR